MRILHVTQPTQAGVAEVVRALASHQARSGDEVSVACPPGTVDGPLAALAEEPGVRFIAWSATRSPGPSIFGEVRALRRLLRGVDVDVLVLHSAKAGLAGRLAVRGRIPTVFVPHAWSFEAATGIVRLAATRWERLAQRWTAATVCVSDDERRRGAAAGVSQRHTVVIQNGVDVERFVPGSSQDARTSLGLRDAPTVVCLGRLTRQKGQDRLVAAWPRVRSRVPEAQLLLVGDGPDRAVLEASLTEGVQLVGATNDPDRYLRAADVVGFASRWEAGALVPLEAMSSARSVVAVDVTGVRDVLGGTGTVVRGGDDSRAIEALGDAVATRLLDPEGTRELGRRARAHVIAHLSLNRTLEQWDDLLSRFRR